MLDLHVADVLLRQSGSAAEAPAPPTADASAAADTNNPSEAQEGMHVDEVGSTQLHCIDPDCVSSVQPFAALWRRQG